MKTSLKRSSALVLLASLASLAHAHGGDLGDAHGAGFWAGLVHPVLGLDHLTAMVAVGIWGAVSSHRAWVAPLAFANMLLVGAMLALSGIVVPMVEPLVAATLLALGLLVATRARLPDWVAVTIAGTFALLHGMAHGSELAGAASNFTVVETLCGVVAATVMLHASGLGLGWWMRGRSLIWSRAAGAVVALAGGVLLIQMT